jgi:large subunit ribosomal protein L13e
MEVEDEPKPLVKSVLNLKLPPKIRVGRGFSLGELKEAGVTLIEVKRLGIRVDKMRKSVHPWNVEALKKLKEEKLKAKAKTEGPAKPSQ